MNSWLRLIGVISSACYLVNLRDVSGVVPPCHGMQGRLVASPRRGERLPDDSVVLRSMLPSSQTTNTAALEGRIELPFLWATSCNHSFILACRPPARPPLSVLCCCCCCCCLYRSDVDEGEMGSWAQSSWSYHAGLWRWQHGGRRRQTSPCRQGAFLFSRSCTCVACALSWVELSRVGLDGCKKNNKQRGIGRSVIRLVIYGVYCMRHPALPSIILHSSITSRHKL